jgi:hypothetical protein
MVPIAAYHLAPHNKSARSSATMSGGRSPRSKGERAERELVKRHEAVGIPAEGYPLSGASHFRGSGHSGGAS